MNKRFLLAFGVIGVLFAAPATWAQSLADLARAEEARRGAVRTPSRVYTNDDLKPGRDPAPASPGAAVTAPAVAPQDAIVPSAPSDTPRAPLKDEVYWRGRITVARAAVERSIVLVEALQNRVDALATDFVNTDDPVRRGVIEQNRLRALAELDRMKKEIADQTRLIADIEEEARRASVPPSWLR